MTARSTKKWFAALAVGVSLGTAAALYACSVPVFRYALERWDRDEYRLLIATSGELSAEDQTRVEQLQRKSYTQEGFYNLRTDVIDLSDEKNRDVINTCPAMADVTQPTAFLLYPAGTYLQTVILQEPFTAETVKKVTTSAFTDDVALDILKGSSAVWIFMESGNRQADDKAFRILNEQIAILKNEIGMPAGVIQTSGDITGGLTEAETENDFDPANILQSGIPLKIDFTVKRLSKEQAEPVLRASLINCEEDLHEYADQPMVFPVFGRGRFIFPLIGDGINAENIEMAAMYVCGICSCQVKAGNPGIDLLSHIDWYSYLDGSEVVIDRALPPLSGTAEWTGEKPAPAEPQAPPEIKAHPSALRRNLVIAIAAVVGILFGTSLNMMKRR